MNIHTSEMPDKTGINADHDPRYMKKSGGLFAGTIGILDGTAAAPSLAALVNTADNWDTGYYCAVANQIGVTCAGVQVAQWVAGQAQLVNGSDAAPAYAFISDPNTGMYRFGVDQIGWACGGTAYLSLSNAALINASTQILNANGAAGAPAYAFTGDTNTGWYWAGANSMRWACNGAAVFSMTTTDINSLIMLRLMNGLVGTLALSFSSDPDTGLYHPAANNIGFVVGGAERMRIDNTGDISILHDVMIGGAIGANPDLRLSVKAGASGDGGANRAQAIFGQDRQTAGDESSIIIGAADLGNMSGNIVYHHAAAGSQYMAIQLGGDAIGSCLNILDTAKIGIGTTTVASEKVVIETTAAFGFAGLQLKQDDQDEPFINFDGTVAADRTKNISTLSNGGNSAAHNVAAPKAADWSFSKMIRVEIDGVADVWIPSYV